MPVIQETPPKNIGNYTSLIYKIEKMIEVKSYISINGKRTISRVIFFFTYNKITRKDIFPKQVRTVN